MKPMSLVAVATRCVFFAALLSCGRRYVPSDYDKRMMKCWDSRQCQMLVSYEHAHLGGADVDVISCDEVYYFHDVAFNASWRVSGGSRHIFEWPGVVPQNGVFPLHGVVAKLLGCGMGKPPGRPGPEAAVLVSPTEFAWAAPAPDNVFLPLEGEVLLDHDFRVKARFEERDFPDAVRFIEVVVTARGEFEQAYGPLHEGDTFPWGDLRATIVRVIRRDEILVGWIEVSLSDPRASEADAH